MNRKRAEAGVRFRDHIRQYEVLNRPVCYMPPRESSHEWKHHTKQLAMRDLVESAVAVAALAILIWLIVDSNMRLPLATGCHILLK